MGMPTATEFLDPVVPQYTADLVSWAAIGARTTESANSTGGDGERTFRCPWDSRTGRMGSLQIALDAMWASAVRTSFRGMDQDGVTSIIRTTGNPAGHVVLRGGRTRTNWDPASIKEAESKLRQAGVPPVLMVDCSHANSGKQHARQEEVWRGIVEQRASGTSSIIGAMVGKSI